MRFFSDIPGRTNIIEQRMHFIDDRSIRCKLYALPYATRREFQEI